LYDVKVRGYKLNLLPQTLNLKPNPFKEVGVMSKEMNRREFLKTSAVTGAMFMAGDIVGRTVHASSLEEVDQVSFTILMDNYVDVTLKSTPMVLRNRIRGIMAPLLSEHGLSVLIDTTQKGQKNTYLMDGGYTRVGVPYNIEKMRVDLTPVEAIYLSHNHVDHHAAMEDILKIIAKPTPVYIHPFAFNTKWIIYPQYKSGPHILNKEKLIDLGARWHVSEKPQQISPHVFTAGTISRTNDFEKIPAIFQYEKEGKLEKDEIWDDGALVFSLRDKGLVVISGCAHAGIVNTVHHAKAITGVQKVHAVLGGFHLTNAPLPKVQRTIQELRAIGPKYLCPMHCTGFDTMAKLKEAFPEEYIISSVGTQIIFA
jgi:7,8-dihydropterin-6-yl-methyl-4-(beta-D-ribofuranosyl)aminobenzene 5'-phosphate synthase